MNEKKTKQNKTKTKTEKKNTKKPNLFIKWSKLKNGSRTIYLHEIQLQLYEDSVIRLRFFLNSESNSVVLNISGKLFHCFAAWKKNECILHEEFGWEVQACVVPEGCNRCFFAWTFRLCNLVYCRGCFCVPVPMTLRSAGAPGILKLQLLVIHRRRLS